MTEKTPSVKPPKSGNNLVYAEILKGVGEGSASAMQGATQKEIGKKDAKERKRRTLANLMNSITKRRQALFRGGQEHDDDLTDQKSQSLQQAARGFVQALRG